MPLLQDAKQNQSYGIKIEIVDEETGLVVDDSLVTLVTYTLQNKDGDFVLTNTPANPVASQTVVLTGTDLDIEDDTQKKEIRYFTAEATVDGKPWANQDSFYIENLIAFTPTPKP